MHFIRSELVAATASQQNCEHTHTPNDVGVVEGQGEVGAEQDGVEL